MTGTNRTAGRDDVTTRDQGHLGRKPRLAILINSFRGGGAERVVSLLLPRLAQDYDLYLVLLSALGFAYPLPENQRTFVLPGEEFKDWPNIIRLPSLARQYHRYLVEHEIDASLSFLNRPNFISCLVKRRGWRGAVIISERAVSSQSYRTGLRKFVGGYLIRALYPRANTIISISKGVEHDLQTTYAVKAHYRAIYNPIDLAGIRSEFASAPEPDPGAPFTFVCVARFDPQKNHALLIEAFSLLGDVRSRLILVGKGPGVEDMRQKVREKGLEDRVEFVGFRKDPVRFLKLANCFVLASDFEGLGNVILEALACSLPVICTDCFSGPREILSPDSDFTQQLKNEIEVAEYGILTPVMNAALLAQAMRRMISDPLLREAFAAKAMKRAQMFGVDAICDDYKSVIAAALSGGDSAKVAGSKV